MMMSRLPFDVTINGGSRFDLCSICSSHSPSSRVFNFNCLAIKVVNLVVLVGFCMNLVLRWEISPGQSLLGFQKRRKHSPMNVIVCRSNGSAFRVSVSPGKSELNNEVKMVDPLVAKQLAKKEMQEFKAKEKLKRQRQIEAINGAWAMIGLTAGLVIEGQTGNSILAQLAGYLSSIISFFAR
ncbi:hypothetical protein Scep_023402 [Stephania cephalantha]|uniref:Uncharacterized protein n=1 Tax=Stephania cephalantha TaxID=152367 RepID=A0AAP0HW94_9MAGN